MSLKALIDLANGNYPPVPPEELERRLAESRKRMAQFDKECEERMRNRIPTQESLNRVIDWGIRHG